ncbi:MAG: DNA-binding transcriptional MerR regulator [Planctomycetota bacterium]|jgi:DNA-binding transcriptional MerR regulator
MAYKEFRIEKLYYSIGEVAELFKVKTSLIRYWETEFSILKPNKNAKGDRMFRQKDMENLKLIYHLVKERKFTLEGAKKAIKEGKTQLMDNYQVIESLSRIRNFLAELKEEI